MKLNRVNLFTRQNKTIRLKQKEFDTIIWMYLEINIANIQLIPLGLGHIFVIHSKQQQQQQNIHSPSGWGVNGYFFFFFKINSRRLKIAKLQAVKSALQSKNTVYHYVQISNISSA